MGSEMCIRDRLKDKRSLFSGDEARRGKLRLVGLETLNEIVGEISNVYAADWIFILVNRFQSYCFAFGQTDIATATPVLATSTS